MFSFKFVPFLFIIYLPSRSIHFFKGCRVFVVESNPFVVAVFDSWGRSSFPTSGHGFSDLSRHAPSIWDLRTTNPFKILITYFLLAISLSFKFGWVVRIFFFRGVTNSEHIFYCHFTGTLTQAALASFPLIITLCHFLFVCSRWPYSLVSLSEKNLHFILTEVEFRACCLVLTWGLFQLHPISPLVEENPSIGSLILSLFSFAQHTHNVMFSEFWRSFGWSCYILSCAPSTVIKQQTSYLSTL